MKKQQLFLSYNFVTLFFFDASCECTLSSNLYKRVVK